MFRIKSVTYVLAAILMMLPSKAWALPLHRIGLNLNTNLPKKVAVVNKTLSAEEAAHSIANNARFVAQHTHTIGWCYMSVKRALKPLGIKLMGAAAWMAGDQLQNDPRFEMASIDDLQPGDILVHGASGAHPFGHIAVYLGNATEASDHVQQLIDGSAYGGTTVYRVKSPITFAVAAFRSHRQRACAARRISVRYRVST
ncbi:MAG TPA: hypothetical protein V6C81_17060 [Planktothrix sp.]